MFFHGMAQHGRAFSFADRGSRDLRSRENSETKVFFTDDGTPYEKHLSLSDDKLKVLKS